MGPLALPAQDARRSDASPALVVNDIHSRLNPTHVRRIERPNDVEALVRVVRRAREAGESISIGGGRHAMGGQQFGEDCVLVDTRNLARIVALDVERGLVTVEAGIQWPELLAGLDRLQTGRDSRWGIVQKQTGADRLTLGGALACNAHGRGLTLPPIIGQVEAFDLVDGSGNLRHCSRTEHPELFRLAIGGYGLFGVVARVQLRLRPRVKVRRVVRLVRTEQVIDLLEERIRDGYEYGDFQFMTDERAGDDFLGLGICACYQPVPDATLMTVRPIGFSAADWARLATLAHTDKRRAFDEYATRYLETCGQIYWSDAQMSSPYADDYHAEIDRACGATATGSEMIGEIFVARRELAAFMTNARRELWRLRANVIYGTVRLIERDDESFLAWAKDRYACVVFNLHVDHTRDAIARASGAFRVLIDLGLAHGGGFYLTYHRWAWRDQVERAYPEMRPFLALKRRHDPDGLFQSTWYRHYAATFGRP